MRSTRRIFLQQSAGVALVAHAGADAATEGSAAHAGSDLLSRMTRLNPPATPGSASAASCRA